MTEVILNNGETLFVVGLSVTMLIAWWAWFLTCMVGNPRHLNKPDWHIFYHVWFGGPIMWVAGLVMLVALLWRSLVAEDE